MKEKEAKLPLYYLVLERVRIYVGRLENYLCKLQVKIVQRLIRKERGEKS